MLGIKYALLNLLNLSKTQVQVINFLNTDAL